MKSNKMKAVIFKELPKESLIEKFREGRPDIVTMYRTDSFGSTSLNLHRSKVYSYEVKDNKVLVNEKNINSDGYKRMFIDTQLSTIEWYIGEIESGKLSKDYYYVIKSCKMGYVLLNDKDVDYCPKEGYKVQEVVYTHLITYDHLSKKTEVINITIYEERERILKELDI